MVLESWTDNRSAREGMTITHFVYYGDTQSEGLLME